jgi:signal transduction histidine kinase
MGKNLTIFQKGLLLSAVPLLAQLLFLGVLGKLQYDAASAGDLAVHTKEVIAQGEATYRHLLEAKSAIRGLVLTGHPAFATAYREAARGVADELDSLEKLVQDNPAQQGRVHAIRIHAAQLIQWLDSQEQMVRAGKREQAVGQVRSLTGQQLLDDLRGDVTHFLAEEDRLDAERMALLRHTSGWLSWSLAGGGVLAVLTTGLLALLFSYGVTGRLRVLRDKARLLTDGKGLGPPLTGRDEVAEVDRAFHEMANALAQKNQENELFVYSVSHDLRSPLVNLQGFSEELNLACLDLRRLLEGPEVPPALRERAARVLEENVAEATHFIRTAVSRLGRIIDALLRLSRAGRVEYRPQDVDLGVLVGRVVEALRGTIHERGAKVVVGDLPPCWGDPTAIEQIFANLLGNALNYLDPGRPGLVEVGTAEGGPGVNPGMRVFFVRDNGLGIAQAYQGRIFTAFQRLHGDAAPGEGIGLALVRRAVERHGGKVWLESVAGQGSTFYFTLPGGASAGQAVMLGGAGAAAAGVGRETAA